LLAFAGRIEKTQIMIEQSVVVVNQSVVGEKWRYRRDSPGGWDLPHGWDLPTAGIFPRLGSSHG